MEILDSRGNPTVRVYVSLKNGIVVAAAEPLAPPPEKMRPWAYNSAGLFSCLSFKVKKYFVGQYFPQRPEVDSYYELW